MKEFLAVFDADLDNAKNDTSKTPAARADPNLAWSPVNSEARLVELVECATKTLVASSENIGDAAIQKR